MKEITSVRQNRTQEVSAYLRDLAQKLGPGGKLPTFTELQKETSASIATLNSAMSILEGERIIRRKHGVGIFVCEQLNHTEVAVLFDPALFSLKGISPYWHLMWQALSEIANGRENSNSQIVTFHVTHTSKNEDERHIQNDLAQGLKSGRYGGVLAVGLSNVAADHIAALGVPLVTHAGSGYWMVNTDSASLVEQGLDYLASVGCRRIGMWSPGDPHLPTASTAATALRQAQMYIDSGTEKGLDIDIRLLRDATLQSYFSGQKVQESRQEQGYHVAMEIFNSAADLIPDGLIIQDDMMTYGVLLALDRLGVRVGTDLRIITQANKGSTVLQGQEHLALLEYDPHEIAEVMFQTLETLLAGELPTQRNITVKPHLIVPKLR